MRTGSSLNLEIKEGKQFDISQYETFLLIPLKDCEMSKFERNFTVHDPELQPLLQVGQ